MEINEAFILNHIDDFELVSISSNRVYRFCQGNDRFMLKVNNLPPDNLSPFWRGIKEIFASDFDTQRENIESTLSLLKNPHIQVAPLIEKSHRHAYQLFREVEGLSYEPDEFPNHDALEYQLGQFIGFLHKTQYDFFGHQKMCLHGDFKERAVNAMHRTIQEYWQDSCAVKELFEDIRRLDISPSSYSFIMTDISANQFVYGDGLSSIKAVVDFDAYVIGPREWELSVIELCLQNGEAFKKGYEEYGVFPDISAHRKFYRFFMYLCDPWDKQDVSAFMSRKTLI